MKKATTQKSKLDPKVAFRKSTMIRIGIPLAIIGWIVSALIGPLLNLLGIDLPAEIRRVIPPSFAALGSLGLLMMSVSCLWINCDSRRLGRAYIALSKNGLDETENFLAATVGNLIPLIISIGALSLILFGIIRT